MPSTALEISRRYFTRSDTTFRPRRKKNEDNWRAYLGEQDFSYKAEFQSRETTPSFPIAVEHIVGTYERALTDSDDWLTADAPGPFKPFLEPAIIQELLQFYMSRIWRPGNHPETGYGIQTLVGDACKRGIMEPTIIAKVWPVMVKKRIFRSKKAKPDAPEGAFPLNEFLGEEMKPVDVDQLRIAVELVPYEDYFPDPSPAKRYEIHRTRRQLHELLANPDYDKDAVRSLLGKATEETYRRNTALNRAEQAVGPDPYVVEVYEAWGDLIDHDTGEVAVVDGVRCENVFWTWAGDQIIRKPTPNPYWDGTRPFITCEMLRVPGSAEGKALADHAVPMWKAINELVNLLLDQAMRAAWGVGQLRPDLMESPEEVADGVPQGYTAVLKPNTPQGLKFYERVDNGEAPQISLENLNRLEGYLQSSLAMPDTKMGQLPQRQTKATEVVQAMQASGSLYESFAARFEDTFLEPLFEKVWKVLIQYADDFLEDELVSILGPTNTLRLIEMSAAERYKMLHSTSFRVRGLRGVASKERGFNKGMTIVNLLSTNPQFADHFGQNYDFAKLWDWLLRMAGIDPLTIELDEEEATAAEEGTAAGEQMAAGQLNPALGGANGASQPNIEGTPQAAAGAQAPPIAPNNPAGNQAVA